ncbi:MAG: MBL fold metallo-hydrolase [Treponemataceae bacterium]|nr:MAG: MBL fold metallo-hydrolase [Treponemataceae bacterium]
MKLIFWGVRGSIPSPLTPVQVREKLETIVQRLQPQNIDTEEHKQAFIEALPSWLLDSVGGNTSCVELCSKEGTHLIFDAGSGIRVLSKVGVQPENKTYHILFSHFHWDHIQGLPFCDFAYDKNYSLHFYSVKKDVAKILSDQMMPPYFPVSFEAFNAKIEFHQFESDVPFKISELQIVSKKMMHPGGSQFFAVTEGKKKFIYATDAELSSIDFEATDENAAFFQNADVIVLDAQYTFQEAIAKENWGHSAFCYAVDFAVRWSIKKLYLFHHEPSYDDHKISTILEAARKYAECSTDGSIEVFLATEGLEITV